MFSFQINESSLSDTRCMIQDVVKNGATLHEIFSAEMFCHDVISLECWIKHVNMSNVNKAIE